MSSFSENSPSSSGNNIKRYFKKIGQNRQFYAVCEGIIKELRKNNPSAIYLDKKKIYEYIISNKISMNKWIQIIKKFSKEPEWYIIKRKI